MDERGARSGLCIGRNENRDMKEDVAERAWLLQRLQQVPKATQTRICDGKEGGEADERESENDDERFCPLACLLESLLQRPLV